MYRCVSIAAIAAIWLAAGCRDRRSDAGDRRADDISAQSSKPVAPARAIDAGDAGDALARALMSKFECHRCHDGTGLPDLGHNKHCVRCHQDILGDRFEAPRDALTRWKRNIRSIVYVPSLTGIGDRLRRDWVRDYLLNPRDVRPGMIATMPRLALTADDADALAAFLVPRAGRAPPPAGAIERGKQLYGHLGCDACHAFAGVWPRRAAGRYATAPGGERVSEPAPAAIELAPDLAFARERLQADRVAAWIGDATGIKPGTLMPRLALSDADARALAAFVLTAPVPERVAKVVPKRLPVLRREVRYDEVEARVFHKLCWHCHSSPDYALGDGGPGNSGGFGFAGRGMDLSSYTGVAAGSFGPDGRRRSVFKPLEDGTPRLVAHLMARYAELAGQPVDGIRGMPLGLPPLPLEDIQLVDTWIAQGRPR